ncbi:MAG TPA: amidohydrolase family protein [Clostridia bacterium]|nr:amidohydrolase family protein [Clostridia bacterium]
MIIDFHIHLLPEEIGTDPPAFAAVDPYFGYRLVDTPRRRGGHRWVNYDEAARDMAKTGVQRAVVQGWPMISYESCRRQNEYTLAAMQAHPDLFIGFCTVNPNDGINALREIERCIAAGMKGVGELDPEGQGFRLDDEDFLRICDLCIELDVPITLHAGEPLGPRYQGRSTVPLQQYVDLAQKKPLLKMVLAHWGGGLPFYELLKGLPQCLANVYYDTAGHTKPGSPKMLADTVCITGDRKILFGSNYPLVFKTAGPEEPDYGSWLAGLQGAIAGQPALHNVFYHNAARLLGLEKGGEEESCRA